MPWFKEALANPKNQRQLYEKFDNDLKKQVSQYTNGGDILKFACEEFIVCLLTSKAKKSYGRLDICNDDGKGFKFEDDYITILNDITIEINKETGRRTYNKETIQKYLKQKRMALSIKGVNWSNFDSHMK